MTATMWMTDTFGRSFDTTDVSRAAHRYAGRVYSLSCNPKRSTINGRYFAEINQHLGEGATLFNIKLGTGDDPVFAALDGYRQVVTDPMWDVLTLEHECELLRRAVGMMRDRETRQARIMAKLDAALDDLTDVMRSANVPLPAAPGEDDDL